MRINSASPDRSQVLVVHRPRYDDWSLPKGKLERGESWEDGALREIEEETGFVCELGEAVEDVFYQDHKGRRKQVRYFHMRPVSGQFTPSDEVDELAWLGPNDLERLSYARDIELARLALGSDERPKSPTGL